ncbi:MAG: diacylglycerol kinase family lipid kinase [Bacteroidetes bacterium]|nr:diacylglycerol kinase family lipid kinase [Bacteroidota bacterium]MBU1114074.1 diacylglycerol kinase family lipid kinase [Bacteroidota bacterium]MBU1798269.1 diacylglycerol kinase family lipid kinase [Bacteroidota bacterium]
MKIAIIINPEAGKGNGRNFFDKIKDLLEHNSTIEYFLTSKPLHAIEIAKNVSHYDRIIICGGDGTLNEVINGFDINSKAVLGLIPIGSGNDFSLSFHSEKADNMSLLNYYLSDSPKIREVNFGNVKIVDSNGKEFHKRLINSFGVGFDAKVAFYNQHNKVFSGTFSYIYSILKSLFEFNKIDFDATYDNKKISGNALFCAVGNGRSIGGGLYLMPNAKIDDNILNLSVVSINSRFKLLTLLPKAMSNSLTTRKELVQYEFTKLNITLNTPFYTHIDGEVITDKAKNIQVDISDKKLYFMCKYGRGLNVF